ncbi:hypothetical protein VitviT2T_015728 [Vitis vinifera]|uniref:Uncharacterized protein n=1 Tax=Vitis vinifera TaxID=29760 RepID=A0ABY9CPU8_VITVI|nr:hypothetical protein VitviT2T_015728 [Vitis vinifera]
MSFQISLQTLTSCSRLPINLTDKLSSCTFAIIAGAAFGEKCKDQDAFILVLKETLELLFGLCVTNMYPSVKWLDLISGMRYKIEKVFQRTDRILQNIVDEHRDKMQTEAGKLQGEENIVDVLLKIQQHGDHEFPLTDNNIKSNHTG